MTQLTALFNNMWILKFEAQATNVFFATVNQMFGSSSQLDYCQAYDNQIAEHNSDQETVLGSSWKLGGAAEHLIGGSKKHICRLSL